MKVNPIPTDCPAISPYLTVPDAARLIEFLKQAFGGVEHGIIKRPDGAVMHAQVRIRDSLVMIGQAPGESKPRSNMLYLYVADVDATYKQALAAGGTSMVEPADMFYGDRHACVRDMAGNEWWLASRIENLSLEEIQKRAAEFMAKMAKSSA